jgi:hypothetical protein
VSEQDTRAVVEILKRIEAKLDEVAVSTRKVRDFRKADGPRWARLWRRLDDVEHMARRGSVW